MKHTLFALAIALAGCTVDSVDDAPAFDHDAPRVRIETPARGTAAGDVTHVLVTGTVSDDSGSVASLTVNGVAAVLGDDGSWAADVPVVAGTNLLRAIATDAQHNRGELTRAVSVGPTVTLGQRVTSGVQTTVSAQSLGALGRDAASFIAAGGLMPVAADMNPVVTARTSDCQYATASITSLTVGDADVRLEPATGGIAVTTVVDNAVIGTHLAWMDSCTAGMTDATLTAQRVVVHGVLTVGIAGNGLAVHLEEPSVEITGFDPQLPDVPASIVQMLALDSAAGSVVRGLSERLIVPLATQPIATLATSRTIDVGGALVDVGVTPTHVSFTPDGGVITLDTLLRAHGDRGSFVMIPNAAPPAAAQGGLDLVVADDAANQLLASVWSAGGFDRTISLDGGAYPAIRKFYDTAELHLAAPPFVDASGSPLQLTVGDWLFTFKLGHAFGVTAAVHAKNALYVTADAGGSLRMAVSTPAVDVDIIEGGEAMTKAEYDAIKSFAQGRVQALTSAALAGIPLPALGKATLPTPWVDAQAGYLRVAGDVD